MKLLKDEQIKPTKYADKDLSVDNDLLAHLKALRKTLAARASVPAYVVFADAALIDMCKKKPKTMAEFSNVSGVGRAKLERYGEIFIKAIKEFDEAGSADLE